MTTDSQLDAFMADEYAHVVSAVALIAGNRDAAADAVQDALVGYLAPPPKTVRNLAAWITVAASNKARSAWRSAGAQSRAYSRLGGLRDADADGGLGGQAVGTPGEVALDIDLTAALAKLPDRQREACVLHYLLDQSIPQIAEGLGISTGTVKTQLHRGRKTLAKYVTKGGKHV